MYTVKYPPYTQYTATIPLPSTLLPAQFDTQGLITGVVDTDPTRLASFLRIRIGIQALVTDPDSCRATV